jgi:hypothetical protein
MRKSRVEAEIRDGKVVRIHEEALEEEEAAADEREEEEEEEEEGYDDEEGYDGGRFRSRSLFLARLRAARRVGRGLWPSCAG